MEVVLGYLWAPMHVKVFQKQMTSFCVLEISNVEQRKQLAFSMYKI